MADFNTDKPIDLTRWLEPSLLKLINRLKVQPEKIELEPIKLSEKIGKPEAESSTTNKNSEIIGPVSLAPKLAKPSTPVPPGAEATPIRITDAKLERVDLSKMIRDTLEGYGYIPTQLEIIKLSEIIAQTPEVKALLASK